jgi:hypothetical protein
MCSTNLQHRAERERAITDVVVVTHDLSAFSSGPHPFHLTEIGSNAGNIPVSIDPCHRQRVVVCCPSRSIDLVFLMTFPFMACRALISSCSCAFASSTGRC